MGSEARLRPCSGPGAPPDSGRRASMGAAMGCVGGHAGSSEGDWNAAEVLSECRPYMFSLMAFEAMFLLYAEGLEGVVVDGRRLHLRLRIGVSRANDRRLSYSVWEGEAARPGEAPPLLVRRVLWDQAADQARRLVYSRSLGAGYGWPDADLLGLWPDLSLDSAPLGPEAAAGLLPALAGAEGALAAPGALSGGVGGEGDWDGFSLEGPPAPGAPYASSRRLRWGWPVGDPRAESAVLRAMGAIDRELSRPAAPPASMAFEYACPPDSYLRALAGPGRLAPGAAAHARAELAPGAAARSSASAAPASRRGSARPRPPPASSGAPSPPACASPPTSWSPASGTGSPPRAGRS